MQTQNKDIDKLWTLQFIHLVFLGTLTSISFNMVTPTLAKYATQLGASLTLAGFISGLISITAMVARPFSGLVADRVNRKKLLVMATTLIGVAALGYSISGNLTALIGFRILHGAAFAISSTVNVTLVAALVPRSRLSEGIGYYGLCQIVSLAIGPSLGLTIGNRFGYRMAYLASAVLIITAAVLMTKIHYHHHQVTDKKGKINFSDIISIKVIPLALIGGFFSLLNGIINTFLVLLGDERGITKISLYFTVNAITLFAVRPFVGKLSDRKGLSFILYPSLVLAAIAAALLGSAASIGMIVTAAVIKAVAQGTAQPTLQATCLKMLPFTQSGVAVSTFYIGADIGQGIGPIIGGAISAAFSYRMMFYFCSAMLLLCMLFYLIYTQINQKRSEKYGHYDTPGQ